MLQRAGEFVAHLTPEAGADVCRAIASCVSYKDGAALGFDLLAEALSSAVACDLVKHDDEAFSLGMMEVVRGALWTAAEAIGLYVAFKTPAPIAPVVTSKGVVLDTEEKCREHVRRRITALPHFRNAAKKYGNHPWMRGPLVSALCGLRGIDSEAAEAQLDAWAAEKAGGAHA